MHVSPRGVSSRSAVAKLDYRSVDVYLKQHFRVRMVYAIHYEAAGGGSAAEEKQRLEICGGPAAGKSERRCMRGYFWIWPAATAMVPWLETMA